MKIKPGALFCFCARPPVLCNLFSTESLHCAPTNGKNRSPGIAIAETHRTCSWCQLTFQRVERAKEDKDGLSGEFFFNYRQLLLVENISKVNSFALYRTFKARYNYNLNFFTFLLIFIHQPRFHHILPNYIF